MQKWRSLDWTPEKYIYGFVYFSIGASMNIWLCLLYIQVWYYQFTGENRPNQEGQGYVIQEYVIQEYVGKLLPTKIVLRIQIPLDWESESFRNNIRKRINDRLSNGKICEVSESD